METLTKDQALAQGYTKCLVDNSEWGAAFNIEDLKEIDFQEENWVILRKEPEFFSLPQDLLKDCVMDHVSDQECQINCDTEMGTDALDGFDWKLADALIEKLNERLAQAPYWTSTGIKLIY